MTSLSTCTESYQTPAIYGQIWRAEIFFALHFFMPFSMVGLFSFRLFNLWVEKSQFRNRLASEVSGLGNPSHRRLRPDLIGEN